MPSPLLPSCLPPSSLSSPGSLPPAYQIRGHVSKHFLGEGRPTAPLGWCYKPYFTGTYHVLGTVTYMFHVHQSAHQSHNLFYEVVGVTVPFHNWGHWRQRDQVSRPGSGREQAAGAEPLTLSSSSVDQPSESPRNLAARVPAPRSSAGHPALLLQAPSLPPPHPLASKPESWPGQI